MPKTVQPHSDPAAGQRAIAEAPKAGDPTRVAADASDRALLALLDRLQSTTDPSQIQELSARIEEVVFHKQFSDRIGTSKP